MYVPGSVGAASLSRSLQNGLCLVWPGWPYCSEAWHKPLQKKDKSIVSYKEYYIEDALLGVGSL